MAPVRDGTYGPGMRVLALLVALVSPTLAGPSYAAAAAPAERAAAAQDCGADFRTVARKPIREVGSGDRIGTSLLKVRTGAEPAYCLDAAFLGAYRTKKYGTSLFMITDDYLGQLYDGTYSSNAALEPTCLSMAAVETGQQLRLQVRVFLDDGKNTPAVAKSGGRLKVATTPTIASPFRSSAKLKCHEEDVD